MADITTFCFLHRQLRAVDHGRRNLERKENPHFTAYSAGSFPSGRCGQRRLKQLELAKLPTDGARSKSWDEFAKPGAPDDEFCLSRCATTPLKKFARSGRGSL